MAVGISIGVIVALLLATLPRIESESPTVHTRVIAAVGTTCATGASPVMPGYDPVTHEIYVPNFGFFGASSISVFNKTCNLVGTIPLASGSWPFQAAFDPDDNDMYVTDFGLDEVNIISGTTIVSNATGFDGPEGITYDPSSLAMVVVNHDADTVDYVQGTYVALAFYTGSLPYEIVYDSSCGCDVVTNDGSGNITVFETRTLSWFSVAVGTDPTGIAYDAHDGYLYVANTGSDNVSVLIDDIVFYSMSGFNQPSAIAYDQAALGVYVANEGNGKVFVISSHFVIKKESTAAGSGADGEAYDEFNDRMYVTGASTNRAYVLS